MRNLLVDVAPDHLEKLVRKVSPAKALMELIWNALDADASRVEVNFERNELETIAAVRVGDDGHGISYDETNVAFGSLGGSKKLQKRRSPSGRPYHGRSGQGRYRSFVLGDQVKWESTYRDDDGIVKQFEVVGDRHALKQFQISDAPQAISSGVPGVIVTVQSVQSESVVNLDVGEITQKLTGMLAPYLLAHPSVKVSVDGRVIDPRATLKEVHHVNVQVDLPAIPPTAVHCQIYEWNIGEHRNRFLCSGDGMPVAEDASAGLRPSPFSHTVYVFSDYVANIIDETDVEVGAIDSTYREIMMAVNQALMTFAREKLAEQAREAVQQLKAEEIYPYMGQASTPLEQAERDVFDICAVRVHQLLPSFREQSRESKHLVMRLLRESIEQNPNSMKRVLREVLKLSKKDLDEFAGILERTSLSAVISATKLVGDRLTFISGLEQILFDPDFSKVVKERVHLHRILVNELWVFGDQYQYGVDDVTLRNVLKHHLSILGREELAANLTPEDVRGLENIPDICLWRQYLQGRQDHYEHLVIELKRPKEPLRRDHLMQVTDYAMAVSDNRHFDKSKTRWTFILLGTTMDSFVRSQVNQRNRPEGLYYESDNVQVWAYEWNQVVQAAKGRLQFLRDKLHYSIDNDDGLAFLRQYYDKFLPTVVR